MPEVIESIASFEKKCDGADFLSRDAQRKKALEQYFGRKGIIQVEFPRSEEGTLQFKDWPSLIYPPTDKLQLQIDELEEKRKRFFSSKWNWQLTHAKARTRDVVQHAKKLVDPLFWQHLTKNATDKEYRSAAKSIGIRSKLIANEKYRPMIQNFVHNPDYRAQLLETVKHSPAYQHHEGLAKNADQQKELQLHISSSQLEKTEAKLLEIESQLASLRELLRWSKER
ncbi:MAG: hypothetical protein IPJ89_01430 [Candidatus Iainarchaeum archaeon]|uniref:Uncharacterized protein n=1 Tax=Candidatus Iainarchaeum sp. TaxID=3101447 RepID=A0A7T9DKA3_9ARCH|nr:MAG: hypothetical protein IPJ89_01430 [Candidatus Diapherotrites archaeon]